MWIHFIKEIDSELGFNEPATMESIQIVEQQLKAIIPQSLRSLLLETDGVHHSEFYYDIFWPVERILKENQNIRNEDDVEYYDSFDHLLFFSDAGNGDLFAFLVSNGKVESDEVIVWKHENDSRERISSSLEEFVKGWLEGTIGV
ncbi:SMI1/KNR4 family protein [Paenibacillus rhizovicinus]|uniref:SMI1/KNR4 family protein n=1 Tax=Paenibacillus rhizovicinus TaxID=2704463 RepID=A0A6C0P4S6_9BACL|nr:SMI1/KNR4 family protein [Paenibacillus rhizovicinus]QHW31672.1 SMI1/KNR4 family protein [Paenibacillus rhizovicinus]